MRIFHYFYDIVFFFKIEIYVFKTLKSIFSEQKMQEPKKGIFILFKVCLPS